MQCLAGKIINGREIAAQIDAETLSLLERCAQAGRSPAVGVVSIGSDPAAESYSRQKEKIAQKLGISYRKVSLESDTSQADAEAAVERLSRDTTVDAILIHTPIPQHLDTQRLCDRIASAKDVDCSGTYNRGLMYSGHPVHSPATAMAVVEIISRSGLGPSGKHVVVLGRSMVIGMPLATLLLQKGGKGDATVTVCHSKTSNIEKYTREADILVSAVGKPGYVGREMVTPDTSVIDVGINSIPSPESKSGFRLVGDVDFDSVAEIASAITPVPGGVGPVTTSVLMRSVVSACLISMNLSGGSVESHLQ